MDGNTRRAAPLLRAIRGPVTLITLGVLFTLDHFTPYSFSQTWPVLLIVFGLLSLIRHSIPAGPMDVPPPPPQGGQPWAPAPPVGYPGGGTYRQSQYGGASPTGVSGQPGPGGSPEGTPESPAGGSR